MTSRVQEPNEDDWKKVRRLIQYLYNTKDLHLVLRWDGTKIARRHVDAVFTVHRNFKSHSGGDVTRAWWQYSFWKYSTEDQHAQFDGGRTGIS